MNKNDQVSFADLEEPIGAGGKLRAAGNLRNVPLFDLTPDFSNLSSSTSTFCCTCQRSLSLDWKVREVDSSPLCPDPMQSWKGRVGLLHICRVTWKNIFCWSVHFWSHFQFKLIQRRKKGNLATIHAVQCPWQFKGEILPIVTYRVDMQGFTKIATNSTKHWH